MIVESMSIVLRMSRRNQETGPGSARPAHPLVRMMADKQRRSGEMSKQWQDVQTLGTHSVSSIIRIISHGEEALHSSKNLSNMQSLLHVLLVGWLGDICMS